MVYLILFYGYSLLVYLYVLPRFVLFTTFVPFAFTFCRSTCIYRWILPPFSCCLLVPFILYLVPILLRSRFSPFCTAHPAYSVPRCGYSLPVALYTSFTATALRVRLVYTFAVCLRFYRSRTPPARCLDFTAVSAPHTTHVPTTFSYLHSRILPLRTIPACGSPVRVILLLPLVYAVTTTGLLCLGYTHVTFKRTHSLLLRLVATPYHCRAFLWLQHVATHVLVGSLARFAAPLPATCVHAILRSWFGSRHVTVRTCAFAGTPAVLPHVARTRSRLPAVYVLASTPFTGCVCLCRQHLRTTCRCVSSPLRSSTRLPVPPLHGCGLLPFWLHRGLPARGCHAAFVLPVCTTPVYTHVPTHGCTRYARSAPLPHGCRRSVTVYLPRLRYLAVAVLCLAICLVLHLRLVFYTTRLYGWVTDAFIFLPVPFATGLRTFTHAPYPRSDYTFRCVYHTAGSLPHLLPASV